MKLFFLFLVLSLPVFAQYEKEADSLINVIRSSGTPPSPEQLSRLTIILYTSNHNSGKIISDKILKIAPGLDDKKLYISTLIHSWRFYTPGKNIIMTSKAYELAKEINDQYYMGQALIYKATAFRDNSMTDSSMFYSLKARDIYENTEYKADQIAALNLIADLHYYAGQYDRAEAIYNRILNSNVPLNWRYNTVKNNIGLIRIKQNRFSEAESYFLESYKQKITEHDSISLIYILRKLLEINVLQQDYTNAEKFYLRGMSISGKIKNTSQLPGFYAFKGRMAYELGQYDSAIVFLKKAEELNIHLPDLSNEISTYESLANTYTALSNFKNSNYYMSLLRQAEHKSDSVFHRARYMNMYAENSYHRSMLQVENYKREKNFLLFILTVISISFLTILLYFFRLRKSNKMLVEKNLELAYSEPHEGHQQRLYYKEPEPALVEISGSKKNLAEEPKKIINPDIINNLIEKLEELISTEKVFLNPDLTINELSEKLNTNRTYLSKAILESKDMNFVNYINSLRIKEAIRIISEGEHKNLNIDGIAQKSGYNNRVSFTKAFQKYSGVNPSFFIKNANELTDKIHSRNKANDNNGRLKE